MLLTQLYCLPYIGAATLHCQRCDGKCGLGLDIIADLMSSMGGGGQKEMHMRAYNTSGNGEKFDVGAKHQLAASVCQAVYLF